MLVAASIGCGRAAAPGAAPPVGMDPAEAPKPGSGAPPTAVPEPECSGTPTVGPAGEWRHSIASPAVTAVGDPRHRGIDLITGAGAQTQAIRGEVRYGLVDKALEDEAVDLFACRAGQWRALGQAITDGEGTFTLELTGDARLPIGLRTLYLSVVGDRTAASFVALVVQDGSELVVSDVDGTLTSSENAFPESLATGADVAAQDGAPDALAALRQRSYLPVYLTARGRYFTEATRTWLGDHGFPRGPLRLASSVVTLPGSTTVDYKAGTMTDLEAAGLTVAVGIGNRASDAEAYGRVGVAGNHVFLKLPEFASEDAAVIASGGAVGFDSYVALKPILAALPLAP
jgi:LNS2 (Lipin/Ned1/Smp2)